MHMQEGEQFFVNRITFVGNNTTRDHVIRREMNLVENGIFNTEALKHSVKRLNQLGYFKQLEGNEAIKVEKTPQEKNQVDVTLKLEEQNRNQLQFGAGYSQYEGTFLQFAFSTSNFMGRGETLSTSVLTGARYKDYQVSFTEPFLFDRPITGGVNVFNRNIVYPFQFTQETSGGNIMFGMPVKSVFSRLYMRYSLENVSIKDLNTEFYDPRDDRALPVSARRAADQRGRHAGRPPHHQQGHAELRLQHRRQSDLPVGGHALHRVDRSGRPRRQHELLQADGRADQVPSSTRAARRSASARSSNTRSRSAAPSALPFFERLVLGGEYSVRGYDVRSIGPYDPDVGPRARRQQEPAVQR